MSVRKRRIAWPNVSKMLALPQKGGGGCPLPKPILPMPAFWEHLGRIAIWAMPKCRVHHPKWGFPKMQREEEKLQTRKWSSYKSARKQNFAPPGPTLTLQEVFLQFFCKVTPHPIPLTYFCLVSNNPTLLHEHEF